MPPIHESLFLVALIVAATNRDLKEGVTHEQWESIRAAMSSNTVSAVKKRVDRLQDEMKIKAVSGGYAADVVKATPSKRATSSSDSAADRPKKLCTSKKAIKNAEAEIDPELEVEK
ncbi:hypothetical protein BJ875DRAFT_495055 [Amylocarpus encephaloides]|uniref:Uncharacterized protein n=1 Tax=Amylocarpus encephaloides TaxID=45428 RepID=A0A9P8C656_9HELO|nr:hypothetical protein BJ875DRAFT_495055 [Amylocarpus encephaloides]